MSFESLPRNLRDVPIDTDKLAADLTDLCCMVRDRVAGSLTAMLLDQHRRMVQVFTVAEVPQRMTRADVQAFTALLVPKVHDAGGGFLLARGKRSDIVTDDDRDVHQWLLDCLADVGDPTPLLGFLVAGPTRIHRLPDPQGSLVH